MQVATRKPVLTLGLFFFTIGILWSVNVDGPEELLYQPQPAANNVQLLPMQEPFIWYSPLRSQPVAQASDSVHAQSPAIETYLIQGVMVLGVIIVLLSTLLVGRRQVSEEPAAEVFARLPEVEAARILEMEHEQARLAIAALRGAHRMKVLQAIVALGDTPEDLPVVQVPTQEQHELTSCS
jgi:hypothetical protein